MYLLPIFIKTFGPKLFSRFIKIAIVELNLLSQFMVSTFQYQLILKIDPQTDPPPKQVKEVGHEEENTWI